MAVSEVFSPEAGASTAAASVEASAAVGAPAAAVVVVVEAFLPFFFSPLNQFSGIWYLSLLRFLRIVLAGEGGRGGEGGGERLTTRREVAIGMQ